MSEIADSLISGEFDYITGEYLGEAVGYPRTVYGKHHARQKKPISKEYVAIANMCKDRGFDNRERGGLIERFLRGKGYSPMPKMAQQCEIIYAQYKREFRKFLTEEVKRRES